LSRHGLTMAMPVLILAVGPGHCQGATLVGCLFCFQLDEHPQGDQVVVRAANTAGTGNHHLSCCCCIVAGSVGDDWCCGVCVCVWRMLCLLVLFLCACAPSFDCLSMSRPTLLDVCVHFFGVSRFTTVRIVLPLVGHRWWKDAQRVWSRAS
jgi:hypothetical protein